MHGHIARLGRSARTAEAAGIFAGGGCDKSVGSLQCARVGDLQGCGHGLFCYGPHEGDGSDGRGPPDRVACTPS
jgi:hypothetical protein